MRTVWSLLASVILYAMLTSSGTSAESPVVKFLPGKVLHKFRSSSDVEWNSPGHFLGLSLVPHTNMQEISFAIEHRKQFPNRLLFFQDWNGFILWCVSVTVGTHHVRGVGQVCALCQFTSQCSED